MFSKLTNKKISANDVEEASKKGFGNSSFVGYFMLQYLDIEKIRAALDKKALEALVDSYSKVWKKCEKKTPGCTVGRSSNNPIGSSWCFTRLSNLSDKEIFKVVVNTFVEVCVESDQMEKKTMGQYGIPPGFCANLCFGHFKFGTGTTEQEQFGKVFQDAQEFSNVVRHSGSTLLVDEAIQRNASWLTVRKVGPVGSRESDGEQMAFDVLLDNKSKSAFELYNEAYEVFEKNDTLTAIDKFKKAAKEFKQSKGEKDKLTDLLIKRCEYILTQEK